MYPGYLSIDGIEIINEARTAAYVRYGLPGIEMICDGDMLANALGHTAYSNPSTDNAPWTRPTSYPSLYFYGLYPRARGIQGSEDGTREVDTTQLAGHGAVHTSPRHGSLEMRVTLTAFAATEEAMMEGLAWLKDVLAGDGNSDANPGCTGRTVRMYAAQPAEPVQAYSLAREFYDVEVTEAPRVTKKLGSKRGVVWELEFSMEAGRPWAHTLTSKVGQLAMDDGVNYQDPVEDCAAVRSGYDDFVNDPFFTDISKPPQPSLILPPNILDITSWRRRTLQLTPTLTGRWGRVLPVVKVYTENAVQYLRLRFYRVNAGLSGCDYDGEFLVSYIPDTAVLTLDAIRRSATLTLSNGKVVPAGHLLFGSDGQPFLWPSLGGQHNYNMTADLMPGQPGVLVTLDAAVRE